MASFSVEEVIEKVLESDGECEDEEEDQDQEERDSVNSSVDVWLNSFPAIEGLNRELFRDIAVEVLVPIVKQCSVSCDHGEPQSNERSKAVKLLTSSTINAASILRSESLQWIKRMHTRLGGKVAYHAKIVRCIPYEVFRAARHVVSENDSGSFHEPRCYVRKNNKADVICLTSLYSFQKILSLISALSIRKIKTYCTRKLKAKNREGHIVKLLVEEDKQLALTYWIKRGQLDISFEYGEWNSKDYPFHNCKFDPNSLR